MDSSASEKLRSKFKNRDWRTETTDLVDQIGQLYISEELADVFFVFRHGNSTTKIPAHQLILTAASEVFEKELAYARQKNSANAKEAGHGKLEIVVTDPLVEPDAFRIMQKFIYQNYKDAPLSVYSIMDVLYLANKYLIHPLIRKCEKFLRYSLNTENAFVVLQYMIDCEVDRRLQNKCTKIICTKTKEVLESEDFLNISLKCLIFFLEQDSLTAFEVDLFNSAVAWAKSLIKKDKNKEKISGLNEGEILRSKLGAALHRIRFATMSEKEFAEFVVPSGILHEDERLDVLRMINGEEPIGQSLCTTKWPREGKWNFFLLEEWRYTICTQFRTNKTRLQVMVRIDGFSSFVASRNEFNSNRISVDGKDKCEWDISLQFCRYNRIRKEFFCVISSSPEPETLGAFVCGTRSDQKECSFDVDAIFRFKRPSTAPDCRYSHKFDFNSANRHYDSWGYWDIARIDEILNEQNGYLVDDSLELLADVTISECE